MEFENVCEVRGTEAKFAVEGEGPLSMCVAAIGARGNISLFSPETTLTIKR